MASLLILLIVAGFAAYEYLKGNFVRSFLTLIIIILASVPAFAFFELVSSFVIGQDSSKVAKLASIAQPLSFFVIFGLCFLIFHIVLTALIKENINLGVIPERIGRVVCGILSGLLLMINFKSLPASS